MADHEVNRALSDSDREENEQPRARRRRADAIPLPNLLRMLQGNRILVDRPRDAAGNNDELVAGLKRSGMLSRCGQHLSVVQLCRVNLVAVTPRLPQQGFQCYEFSILSSTACGFALNVDVNSSLRVDCSCCLTWSHAAATLSRRRC